MLPLEKQASCTIKVHVFCSLRMITLLCAYVYMCLFIYFYMLLYTICTILIPIYLTEPSHARNITITRVFQDGIELNWLPPTEPNGEVHYVVEYKREDSGNWTSLNTTSDSTHYNLTGLHSGTHYTIRVVAVNSAGRAESIVSIMPTTSSAATSTSHLVSSTSSFIKPTPSIVKPTPITTAPISNTTQGHNESNTGG